MSAPQEFLYRLTGRVDGWRPGSHAGTRLGAGQQFATHRRLYDWPDPRRLDLRASLRHPEGDWLVRVNRQRAGVAVQVVVDVSASMNFGASARKLDRAADFVDALGQSAFRAGDTVGMLAFDAIERTELFFPNRLGRGVGSLMAAALRSWTGSGAGAAGLKAALQNLAGRSGLVFLVSDFLWHLDLLDEALALLAHAQVVPLVVWDPAELQAPALDAPALVRDAETGAVRALWIRPSLRRRWDAAVAQRRAALERVLSAHALRPFYLQGAFDGEALSRYFLEGEA